MMNAGTISDRDRLFLRFAVEVARGALSAGNIPIAAIIADESSFISLGVNARIQKASLTLHAEISALENAGRTAIPRLRNATMYCTLSPCAMCTGAILLYRISRIVIADCKTFEGPTELLRQAGTTVLFTDDEEAYSVLQKFRMANPALWDEDNGGLLVSYASHQLLVVTNLDKSRSLHTDHTRLTVVRKRAGPDARQLVARLGSDRRKFRRILVQGPPEEASIGPSGNIGISSIGRYEYAELLELAANRGVRGKGPVGQLWPIYEWFSIREPDGDRAEIGSSQDAPPPTRKQGHHQ